MLPLVPYYLTPCLQAGRLLPVDVYLVWLLLPAIIGQCLIKVALCHPVDKFKPHSFAIPGRATFFIAA